MIQEDDSFNFETNNLSTDPVYKHIYFKDISIEDHDFIHQIETMIEQSNSTKQLSLSLYSELSCFCSVNFHSLVLKNRNIFISLLNLLPNSELDILFTTIVSIDSNYKEVSHFNNIISILFDSNIVYPHIVSIIPIISVIFNKLLFLKSCPSQSINSFREKLLNSDFFDLMPDIERLIISFWNSLESCTLQPKHHLLLFSLLVSQFDLFQSHIKSTRRNVYYEWIQVGLLSDEPDIHKRAIYLLKRSIDQQSSNQIEGIKPCSDIQLVLFQWNHQDSQTISSIWSTFFIIIDAFKQHDIHLISPILSQFSSLFKSKLIHISWILLLFNLGFKNKSLNVRKYILEFFIHSNLLQNINNPNIQLHNLHNYDTEQHDLFKKPTQTRLEVFNDFIFNVFFPNLNQPYLFADNNITKSKFGDSLLRFIMNLFESNEKESKPLLFRRIINNLDLFHYPPPLLYIMESLIEYKSNESIKFINNDCLSTLIDFPKQKESVTVLGKLYAKHLFISYSMKLFLIYTDKNEVSMNSISRFIYQFTDDFLLINNPKDYISIKTFLSNHVDIQVLDSFVCSMIIDYFKTCQSQSLDWNISKCKEITRILMFCEPDMVIRALKPLLNILEFIYRKTYVSDDIKNGAIVLLNCLINQYLQSKQFNSDQTHGKSNENCLFFDIVSNVLINNVDELYNFIETTLFNTDTTMDLKMISIYIQFLDLFCGSGLTITKPSRNCFDEFDSFKKPIIITPFLSSNYPMFKILNRMDKWRSNCIKELLNGNIQPDSEFYSRLTLLGVTCRSQITLEHDPSKSLIEKQPLSDLITLLLNISYKNLHISIKNMFSKAISDCIVSLLKFSILNYDEFDFKLISLLFEYCLNELRTCDAQNSIDSFNLVLELLNIIDETQKKEITSENIVIDMNQCVQDLFDVSIQLFKYIQSSSLYFLTSYSLFIQCTFHPFLLKNTIFSNRVTELFNIILNESEMKTGLMNRVSYQFFNFFSKSNLDEIDSYKNLIFELLLYGPIRTNQKMEQGFASLFTYKLKMYSMSQIEYNENYENTVASNFSLQDFVVRIHAITILSRFDLNNPKHIKSAQEVLELMCLELGKTIDKNACFPDSIGHRKDHRIWVTIHVLLDFIGDEMIPKFIESFQNSLYREANVSSRHYNEWALSRLLVRNHQSIIPFTKHLESHLHKPHVLASFFTVIYQTTKTINKKNVTSIVIDKIVPWMTSHHFNIRVISQYIFYTLYKSLDTKSHLDSTFLFLNHHPESKKQFIKCQKMYYLSELNVCEISIQFLFDNGFFFFECERIPFVSFERCEYNGNIPLKSKSPLLNPFKTMNSDDIPSNFNNIGFLDDMNASIFQRKMDPFYDTDMFMDEIKTRIKKPTFPIILCASLVSKTPNLAGLCRTCEIFGVSCLVVDDTTIQNHPEFKKMSSTANTWMDMVQVKKKDVFDYIIEQKDNGYTIIGVEQSNQSVLLSEFKFPEKCLVLLGTERYGIPPELFESLDYIIEIPQVGMVRSLNVHVSGALVVWEYVKQMKIK